MLVRRWKLIAVVTLVFVLLAAAFAYRLQNYYVATTQILVDPEGTRYVEGELSTGQRATEAHALNQQYILTSAKVLSQVVKAQGLADDPEFGAAAPVDARPEVRSQRALDALQKAVVASLNKASFVVNLSVTTTDPEKAARIANGIANAYMQTRVSMNNGVVRQASNDLSAQLNELEKKVLDGDNAVQAYKATHKLVDVAGRPTVEQRIADTNTEISRISSSIAENEAIVSELGRARADKNYFRSMLDSYLTPSIVALRTRYHDAMEQLSVLEASLGARHPLLQNARARVESTVALLDEQLSTLAVSLSRNADRLKNQRTLLQQNLTNLQESLNKDDNSMVELRELERRLASDRLVYESFLLRTRQLVSQEQTVSENPQILSLAQSPLEKSGPKRSLIIAGAGILGFLIGAGLAIGRERAAAERDTDPEVEAHPRQAPRKAARGADADFDAYLDKLIKTAAGHANYCTLVYASPAVEEPHRSAFHLAQLAAQRGRNVLLVDAASDAALTAETATETCIGLRNSLAIRKIDSDLIKVPGMPTLRIMPAGFRTPLISTRRHSGAEHLVHWLNASKIIFDLVVIDGGHFDQRLAIPEIEQAADELVVLAHGQDKALKASVQALEPKALQFIKPLLLPRKIAA